MGKGKENRLGRRTTNWARQCLSVMLAAALMLTTVPFFGGMVRQASAADEFTGNTVQPILVISGAGIITDGTTPGTYTLANISNEKSYTLDELKSLEEITQLNSAINTTPTRSIFLGKGISIDKLLQESNVASADWGSYEIDVVASDGYTVRFDPAKTGDSATRGRPLKTPAFNVPRYYYPNLKDLTVDLDGSGNYIYSNETAAAVGAESAKSILAWERGGDRGYPEVVPGTTTVLPDGEGPLLLMVGQQNVWEQNNPLFNKTVNKLLVGPVVTATPITVDGTAKTRSEILMMVRADRSYTYTTKSGTQTDYVRGVPLSVLTAGHEDDEVISFTAADGYDMSSASVTVADARANNYILAYEKGTSSADLTGIYETSKDDANIHGYFTLYGDGIKPSKLIDSISVNPAGYTDFTNSPYKHVNNGGLTGSAPYNIDAITGATLTVEGPGVEATTPLRMGDLENTDNGNIYRGIYTDTRSGTATQLNYEGVKVLSIIDGLVNSTVEKVDENINIIFKNRWRQDIGAINYSDLKNAATPVILAYGTGTTDETKVAPFVFDGDAGAVAELGNEDGCLKLVYDQTALPNVSDNLKFVSVAYIYVEKGDGAPGYKHSGATDEAYRNVSNIEQLLTFTGSALGREVNYTVAELEAMVEYTDGLPTPGGLGHRAAYGLSNTTYWYVNEYEGVKLWDLLTTRMGLDAGTYAADEATLVSFAAWDNYKTTAQFSMAQLADPDRFYFYEKSPLDIGTDRPTKEELATEAYQPDNAVGDWTTDSNGYPVKKGYPVMLAYGVNGYPYVRDSSLPGYAGGLGNDGGPVRVIFGKTDGMNRSNPDALENYAYFYNNGSNQLQRAQEIYVGDDTRYNTHLENPSYAAMKDTPAALTVEIIQNGVTNTKTYTLAELESILYAADVVQRDRQARQEKGYYAHKVYSGILLEDLFEGVNLSYLLTEDVGMAGILGTVSLYSGTNTTSSLDIALSDLESTGFNSLRGTESLGTMVAFAKNGYPLVLDKTAAGYIGTDTVTGKTIKNSDGPLMFVRPQTEAEKLAGTPGATVANLTKIVVNLEADVYAHTGTDYASYGDSTIAFSGAVKNEGVTLKVSDIETLQRYMVTDSYTVDGVAATYRGIDLNDLLSSTSVGASALLSEVTLTNASGDSKTVSVADMSSASKPIILAYGIGKAGADPVGKPLVPDADSTGYDAAYGNIGGPMKLIIEGAAAADCIENVTSIAVTASELTGWTHSTGYYEAYKNNTLEISGTNLSGPVTMTVAELEALSDTYKVFGQYKMGNDYYFEGIDLLKLLRDHIGFSGELESSAITVYAKDNYAVPFTATDLSNGINGKPMIIAYGQGTSADHGLPLVDGNDTDDVRDGFDPEIGNAFGPLRLVVHDNSGWCNKWVTRIVVGSDSGGGTPDNYDFTLTNGSEVTNYNIADIKSITEGAGGQATSSYPYFSNLEVKTDYVKGIYLADLLTAAGISGDEATVTINTTDGFESKQASYRDIPLADLTSKNYLLAYDAGASADSLGAISDIDKNDVEATVRIYRNYDDGLTWLNRLTNISGITVSGAEESYTFTVYPGTGTAGELPMASVRDVVTDASGGMWVGTNGGGAWYKPADSDGFTINTLATENYVLGSDVVQAIAVDSTGGIWFSQSKTYNPAQASLNKGAAYVKDGSITYYSTDQAGTIPNNYVQEVRIDPSGKVWFGSFGGLTRFDPATDTWTSWDQSYEDADGDSFPALSVDNLVFDNAGGVWLGFYPTGAGTEASRFVGGFAHMTADGDLTPYQFTADYDSTIGSSLLAQVWVRDIAVDAAGGAWVVASGSYTDLANVGGTIWYVDSTGTATRFTGDQLLGAGSLTGNSEIRMVNVDADGGLWFGTSGDGLFYIADPGTTAPLTISAQYNGTNGAWPDTAQFNNIYALNIIGDTMYLGSDAGVMVAALEDIAGAAPEPTVIETFTISGVGTDDIDYYVGGAYEHTLKGLADDAGKVTSSYPYNGTTHYVKGALLSTLLADAGAGEDIKVTITTSDGYTKASYQDIPYADIAAQNYFVAYDVGEDTDTLSYVADTDGNGVTTSFRIYRNLDGGAADQKDNRIKGVVGITVSPDEGGGGTPVEYDLFISGAGVSTSINYTVDELKTAVGAQKLTRSYDWLNSYGTTGTDEFEGVYLEYLLDDIVGLTSDAASVKVTAGDGYYRGFNLDYSPLGVYWTDIQGNKLMLAWEKNGTPCDLQLVVGQTDADHVNKPMWISDVQFIVVNTAATTPGGGTPGGYEQNKPLPLPVGQVQPNTVVTGDKASTNVSADEIKAALEALKKSAGDEDLPANLLEIDAVSDAEKGQVANSEVILTADAIKSLAQAGDITVKIKTDIGEIVLPPEVIKLLAEQGSESIVINLALTHPSDLDGATSTRIGDRPIVDISLTAGGQNIVDFNGSEIQVYIPYEPQGEEDSNSLLVYYLDEDGAGIPMILSRFDEDTNRMVFSTPHLSLYAVGYNQADFKDLKGHWAKGNIEFLAARDLLKGKTAGYFVPNGNVTRAEFVTMLYNLTGGYAAQDKAADFTDVSADDWYAAYVNWAVSLGIVNGYGNGKFGPNDQITREQMAVMVNNFIKVAEAKLVISQEEKSFTDQSQINSWAAQAVSRVQQLGLISGRPEGSFAPQATATRAEAATIIKSFIDMQ